jgi:DNA-binding transcriptional LysR family regulator
VNWDDFRYFAAVARHGTVRGAAQSMSVNPSTVTRRIEQLEHDLGILLFTRSQHGLALTREATGVLPLVNGIADQFQTVESSLRGLDQRLEGKLRIAVPDVIATSFLLEELALFAARYTAIDIELVPGFQAQDLGTGGIDLAIRATERPPDHLVGRPLTPVALAAYGARHYVAEHQVMVSCAGAAWIDWAAQGEIMQLYAKLREKFFPDVHVHLRCDHIQMHHTAVRANMGLAILPCLLADADPELIRLPHMPVQKSPMLWMLSHPDHRGSRRLQVLMDFLREVFKARQDSLFAAYEKERKA